MKPRRLIMLFVLTAPLTFSSCMVYAQTSDQSWSATTQQGSPDGNMNPTRTSESHSQANGRTVDKTSTERVGPDGRYVPYSDTQTETLQIDKTTTSTITRTF